MYVLSILCMCVQCRECTGVCTHIGVYISAYMCVVVQWCGGHSVAVPVLLADSSLRSPLPANRRLN